VKPGVSQLSGSLDIQTLLYIIVVILLFVVIHSQNLFSNQEYVLLSTVISVQQGLGWC
jgi:hypothetical protein